MGGGVPNLPSILNNWLIIKYFLIYQSQLNFNVYNWRFFFFRYLTNGADSLKHEPTYFKKQYDELVNAMDLVGFTDEEEDNLFSIIAAVLHMGNVTFEMDDNEASFVEDENGPIKMAAVSNLCIWYQNLLNFFFMHN